MDVAYMSDIAVVVLARNLGALTGTMGFKYNKAGYKGRLTAAGYPAQVGAAGRLKGFHLSLGALIQDWGHGSMASRQEATLAHQPLSAMVLPVPQGPRAWALHGVA
jgi:hypothetical protein